MLNKFIQNLNSKLYDSRQPVLISLTIIKFFASIIGVSLVIYGFGIKNSNETIIDVLYWLDFVFGIFVTVFIIKFLYTLKKKTFLTENKFETVLILTIILNGFTNYFFDNILLKVIFESLHLTNFHEFYIAAAISYLIIIIGYEFIVASNSLSSLNLQPSLLFILSFILIIVIGTGMLMLPAMTYNQQGLNFMDALFMSVSATCVTGLSVIDISTVLTYKGQITLLVLIQVGGLGIIAFAMFFARFIRKEVSLREQVLMQDYFSSDSLYSAKQLLKQVVKITLTIELITAIAIYFSWGDQIQFLSIEQKIYYSVFHAISAFCNAGFSLFTDSLFTPVIRYENFLHIIIAVAVILGGLGFAAIEDLLSPKKLRARLQKPWIDWKLGTKIAVYTSVVLIVGGTVFIFILEYDNTLEGLNIGQKLSNSFFQSVIIRTAGFNSVDIGELRNASLVLFIFLMFVGASSGSVGGGIKTSTFFLIMISALATLKGKTRIEINKKEIPNELLFKALSIFFFAASVNLISIFILTITEPDISIIELAFEEVSAFSTVGLSMGLTPSLSTPSRIVLICSMFLGRVGILTFALSLSQRQTRHTFRYPTANIMVG